MHIFIPIYHPQILTAIPDKEDCHFQSRDKKQILLIQHF